MGWLGNPESNYYKNRTRKNTGLYQKKYGGNLRRLGQIASEIEYYKKQIERLNAGKKEILTRLKIANANGALQAHRDQYLKTLMKERLERKQGKIDGSSSP